jgi:hypothetical protein
VGGIHDHRHASGHAIADALVEQGLNVTPGPLNGRIAKKLGAHAIGGEHLCAGELGQHPSQGGFAAGRRADQQVTAQRLGHATRLAKAGALSKSFLRRSKQQVSCCMASWRATCFFAGKNKSEAPIPRSLGGLEP